MSEFACVILAGGRGKRMASTHQHKVCFPVAGRAAIVRAIETYKKAGISRFVVVVGQMAEQVIATVSAVYPEVSFVYQSEPRGTGHAAQIAIEALAAQKFDGAVLLTMGDKVVRPAIVHQLLEAYRGSDAEMVFATLPGSAESEGGRVVSDKTGRVLGIIESADLKRLRRRKRQKLFGGKVSLDQIESAPVNAGMFVARFAPLREALSQLRSNNAQGELYLTDTVELMVSHSRVTTLDVPNAEDIMAFNTPEELMAIEKVIRLREKPPRVRAGRKRISSRQLRSVKAWLKLATSQPSEWRNALKRIYGDESLMEERRGEIIRLLNAFGTRYGTDRMVVLGRAPGRLNLMGRHVDHRGGCVNVLAISREVMMVSSPREDDTVSLANLDKRAFPDRAFQISQRLRETSWADWIDFIESSTVREVLEAARGDWSHYAQAAMLRLQHECSDFALRGMDCMVSGNIPIGSGLSSSSALVVGFAQAAIAINGLHVQPADFIDLCGEGEWFVGSRGGSADHAAISEGRRGYVSTIGFFPFRRMGETALPADWRFVIAYSGNRAVKSAGARDVFNQRVACYNLAERYLRRHWPAAAGAERLRDLLPEKLGVKNSELYRAVMRLPKSCHRAGLKRLFGPQSQEELTRFLSSHNDVGPYDLRGATLYGLSEIARSEQFPRLLKERNWESVERFIRTSHDGDRVSLHDGGAVKPYRSGIGDALLTRLSQQDADLTDQCGRYACSTEPIDAVVDIANTVEGVIGAQLAGAGLGGCAMILVRQRGLETLLRRLRGEFYRPRKIPFAAYVCQPVAGAGLIGV